MQKFDPKKLHLLSQQESSRKIMNLDLVAHLFLECKQIYQMLV